MLRLDLHPNPEAARTRRQRVVAFRETTSSASSYALRLAVVWIALWLGSFLGQDGAAFGTILHSDLTPPDPAQVEKVQAALAKIQESPADISAIETLLAVEPRIVETVGTSETFSRTDPVLNRALSWCQSPQPPDVLAASLEMGSNAAANWALRQIVWRRFNNWFDEKDLSRLMPGIEMALGKPSDATRAQAVRTMLVCLPREKKAAFLEGFLKGQPDQVSAAAVDGFANDLRQSNAEVDAIVAKWLSTSDDPVLFRAGCTYWWLVKSRAPLAPKEEEIAAFERLAGHPDEKVRRAVTLAVEDAAKGQPRLINVLLRLTKDPDVSVKRDAIRALRNADAAEVNARLRELFATDQRGDIRAAAIEVLGIFGKENLPIILSAAKTDNDPGVRQNAVYALRTIGTPEAGKGLEAAQSDSDQGVRDLAREQSEWYRRERSLRK